MCERAFCRLLDDVWLTWLDLEILVIVSEAFVRFAGSENYVWGCEGCGDVSKDL